MTRLRDGLIADDSQLDLLERARTRARS
jgi:hypothetical protein